MTDRETVVMDAKDLDRIVWVLNEAIDDSEHKEWIRSLLDRFRRARGWEP